MCCGGVDATAASFAIFLSFTGLFCHSSAGLDMKYQRQWLSEDSFVQVEEISVASAPLCALNCEAEDSQGSGCSSYRYDAEAKTCKVGSVTSPTTDGDVATFVASTVILQTVLASGLRVSLYKVPLSRPDAVAFCQDRGGRLFEPRTDADRIAAFDLDPDQQSAAAPAYKSWVGLKEDPNDDTRYLWESDGSAFELAGTNAGVDNNNDVEKCFVGKWNGAPDTGGSFMFVDRICGVGATRGYPWCEADP